MPSYKGLDEFWYVKTILASNSYIKWFDIDVLYSYKVSKLKNKNNGIFLGYTLCQKLDYMKCLPEAPLTTKLKTQRIPNKHIEFCILKQDNWL